MEESLYLKDQHHLIEKFKNLPLLKRLDNVYLSDVLDLSKIRKFETGEFVTKEDDYDLWIYILISGEVDIIKNNEKLATITDPGETFGELSVIDGEKRSASVVAATEVVCLGIDVSSLDLVNPKNRSAFRSVFYQLFAEILSSRLRATSNELVRVRQELDECRKLQSS